PTLRKSPDGGTTWNALPAASTKIAHRLVVAANGDVFLGNDDGLFRSADGGATFTKIYAAEAVFSIVASSATTITIGTNAWAPDRRQAARYAAPRMRLRMLLLSGVVALVPSVACHDDDAPPPVVVGASGAPAQVKVGLDPFAITILDAKGNAVLQTMTGGAGD